MNTRQIKTFLALADTLSFTTVANELHLTQPAVSYNIQTLEKELGFALFVRAHNTVRLTALGQSFAQTIKPLCAQFDQAIAQHQRLAADYAATLTIGYTDSLRERQLFPQALRSFRQAAPKVQVDLVRTTFYHEVDALLAQQIDLALTGDDAVINHEGLQFTRLLHGCFGVLVPQAMPLTAPLALSDLDGQTLICYDEKSALPKVSRLTQALRAACPHSLFLSGTGGGMLTTMAQAGLGLAVVPSYVTVPDSDLTFVPLDYPITTDYGAITLAANHSRAVRLWLATLQAVFAVET